MPGKVGEKVKFFLFAFLIFLLDFFSKKIILENLTFGQSLPVVRSIFNLSLVANTGSAFGLFKNLAPFFVFFSFCAIFIIIYIFLNLKSVNRIYFYSLSLILAGAVGNLVDRLTYGFVVDFLDFRIWPVFNLADSAITIGVSLLIFTLIFKKQPTLTAKH
jgi:signal peptidase II